MQIVHSTPFNPSAPTKLINWGVVSQSHVPVVAVVSLNGRSFVKPRLMTVVDLTTRLGSKKTYFGPFFEITNHAIELKLFLDFL